MAVNYIAALSVVFFGVYLGLMASWGTALLLGWWKR